MNSQLMHRALLVAAIPNLVGLAATNAVPLASGESSVVEIAAELGITPESLTVSDLQEWGSSMLNNLAAANAARADLDAKSALAAAAAAALGEATAEMQRSGDNDGIAAAFASAAADFETAQSALASAQAALLEEALSGAPSTAQASLAVWLQSKSRSVPAAFKAVARSAAEWDQIEQALRAEARALARSEEVDETSAALLAAVREDDAVEGAVDRLSSDLATTAATFAVYEE